MMLFVVVVLEVVGLVLVGTGPVVEEALVGQFFLSGVHNELI